MSLACLVGETVAGVGEAHAVELREAPEPAGEVAAEEQVVVTCHLAGVVAVGEDRANLAAARNGVGTILHAQHFWGTSLLNPYLLHIQITPVR